MSKTIEQSGENETTRKGLKRVFKPKIIIEWTALLREVGFKGFIKEKGWKIVIAIFLFYLVRDSVLYIILPYFAARGLFGC